MIKHYDGQRLLNEQHRAMQEKKELKLSDRNATVYDRSFVVLYDCENGLFTYPEELKERFSIESDRKAPWEILRNVP